MIGGAVLPAVEIGTAGWLEHGAPPEKTRRTRKMRATEREEESLRKRSF